MKALLLALVIGCGGGGRSSAPACPSDHPLGSIADYAAPQLLGFRIAAPMQCPRDEAYIRIERTTGLRKLGTGRSTGGGFDEGCMALPADPADATQCPVINAYAILAAAHQELEHRKLEAPGTGLGPCGDPDGDYAAWNMSAGVHDWKHAAELVRIITELLDRYDAAGTVGAAVRGIPCAVLI